jgi:hypothetical protein
MFTASIYKEKLLLLTSIAVFHYYLCTNCCYRCHLASGKTLWLCTEHQKQERIAILSNDVAVAMPTLSRDVDMNIAQILNANNVSTDAVMVNTKSGVTEEPRKPSATSATGRNSRASKTPSDMTSRPPSVSTDKSVPANGQTAATKDAGI